MIDFSSILAYLIFSSSCVGNLEDIGLDSEGGGQGGPFLERNRLDGYRPCKLGTACLKRLLIRSVRFSQRSDDTKGQGVVVSQALQQCVARKSGIGVASFRGGCH